MGGTENPYKNCHLCPRGCGADRTRGRGRCGAGALPRIARAAPHFWEEPCLSGRRGSGAVFFTGCPLGCLFCQNRAISGAECGPALDTQALARVFLALQKRGVHNLNLVSATHHRPAVQRALAAARQQGLSLPLVWNTGGYETVEAVEALAGDVDIWLTDLKFHDAALAGQLAGAPDYFHAAAPALLRMQALAGPPVFDGEGLLRRGVILRLLVLPGQAADAQALLRWLAQSLPPGGFLLSLMSQYTPPPGADLPPPFHRRLASYEYRRAADTALALGLERGYFQQRDSAYTAYTPPFNTAGR